MKVKNLNSIGMGLGDKRKKGVGGFWTLEFIFEKVLEEIEGLPNESFTKR